MNQGIMGVERFTGGWWTSPFCFFDAACRGAAIGLELYYQAKGLTLSGKRTDTEKENDAKKMQK